MEKTKPKPKQRLVTQVPPVRLEEIVALADQEQRTVSAMADILLAEALAARQKAAVQA